MTSALGSGCLTTFVVLTVAASFGAVPPVAPAVQTGDPNVAIPAPDLDLVPPDALGFCRVRLGDVWRSQLFWQLLDASVIDGKLGRDFEKRFGVGPVGLTAFTVVLLPPADEKSGPAVALIAYTVEITDPAVVLNLVLPDGVETKHGTRRYFSSPRQKNLAVYFANDRTVVYAPEAALLRLMDGTQQAGPGPLAAPLKVARQHHIIGAFRVRPEDRKRWATEMKPAVGDWARPLLDIETGTFVLDFGQKAAGAFTFVLPDEARARGAAEAVKRGLKDLDAVWKTLAGSLSYRFADDSAGKKEVLATVVPVKRAKDALPLGRVEQQGREVRIAIEAGLSADDYTAFLWGLTKGISPAPESASAGEKEPRK